MTSATYITHMGDDLLVVNAARVSFAKESKSFGPNDAGLIDFLARNGHWTPFAHSHITLRITAPIFVRTQCFKHKVGFVENEISRRYVTDGVEFYVPSSWRGPAENKKQGSSGLAPNQDDIATAVQGFYRQALETYSFLLAAGVAPEQARMVLPQSTMTEWYWTGSLAAWARFINLRSAPDAQEEIRNLADHIADIINPLFPVSLPALTKKREGR